MDGGALAGRSGQHYGSEGFELELDVNTGSVEMRLPEGASASLDGVEARLGSVDDHRREASATGRPHFVLKCQITRGSGGSRATAQPEEPIEVGRLGGL